MNQYVLLTLALLPPIAILWFLLENDLKERNNSLVYKLFIVGAFLAVPIYYSETFLINNILKSNPFTISFLVASLIEEGAKFLVFIAIIAFICYQLTEVVLTFHHSDYEKIKFSGEEDFLRPGGGKIYN